MKIVLISDSHGKHSEINVPAGDLLIHAGDLSSRGTPDQVRDFMEWFGELPHPYRVFIAGNHDFLAEDNPAEFEALIPPGVIYLNDTGVTIDGIRIWGSPITPWFFDWAFNRQRGAEIKKHWDLIPPETDLLITHGPPKGILDKTHRGEPVGCEDLSERINLIKPKLHVFGHIHEAFGISQLGATRFINASVLDARYSMANDPVVLDWPF